MSPQPEPSTPANVVTDPILTIETGQRCTRLSLADLLSRLLQGPEVDTFPSLSAEQRSYWWRFLVRCGAKALHDTGLSVHSATERSDLAGVIAHVLQAAAVGGAWDLYQPDPAKPGFMQPPAPDGIAVERGYASNSPGLLTGALGAKNHERKFDVVRRATAEQIVYALVEYQTAAIYGGRGNYGSQLSGSASGAGSGTPFMGARIGDSNVQTFRHDVAVMLARWDRTRYEHGLEGKVWALWAEPWDGKSQIQSRQLDPAFIPTARLVRLGAPVEGWFTTVWFHPSDGARVKDLSGGGNLGDPFTPLVADPKRPDTRKVRGTLDKGYDYTEVVRLLFGSDAEPSPSVRALADDAYEARTDLTVLFEGVAYEQGKTGGFHRREVVLPALVTGFFSDPEPMRLAHTHMLERVKAAKSAIRGAVRVFLTGTPKPRDGDAARVDPPAADLDGRIDRQYLPSLFVYARLQREGDDAWIWAWGSKLRDLSRSVFETALPSLPMKVARRFEREALAWGYLDHKLAQLADPDFALRTAEGRRETEEVSE